jgi:hypothetical protein
MSFASTLPAFGKWSHAEREAALTFLRDVKRVSRRRDVVLCLVDWIGSRNGTETVCVADVRALYPRSPDAGVEPLLIIHNLTRVMVTDGLLEQIATGVLSLTPLGRAIVDALPDAARAAALRSAHSPYKTLRK